MTDLMKELMAEVARVNKMEVEIERTVELQNEAVQTQRKAKAQDVALFLQVLCDALIEADAMRDSRRGPFFVLPGVSYKDIDGFNRDVGIIFYTDEIYVGGYYIGSGSCSKLESFCHAANHFPVTKAMKALIDTWDGEMELRVKEACMKQIKQTLKNRMEAMQNTLQKSNDEYAKYVR